MVNHLIFIGNADEDKKLNATYLISVARKLGCSIFLLPEDIIEVMILVQVINDLFSYPYMEAVPE